MAQTYFIPLVDALRPTYALAYVQKDWILENERELQVTSNNCGIFLPITFRNQRKFHALPSRDVVVHYLPEEIARKLRIQNRFLTERKDLNIPEITKRRLPFRYKLNYLLRVLKEKLKILP